MRNDHPHRQHHRAKVTIEIEITTGTKIPAIFIHKLHRKLCSLWLLAPLNDLRERWRFTSKLSSAIKWSPVFWFTVPAKNAGSSFFFLQGIGSPEISFHRWKEFPEIIFSRLTGIFLRAERWFQFLFELLRSQFLANSIKFCPSEF